jgi:multicomponent Na+:H+ antiporter subunit B
MSTRGRVLVMAAGVGALAAFLCWGLRGIPGFGDYGGPYGNIINAVGQKERNLTDMVTAVNFDYRAIDTVGEEFILFISVAGIAVVLRRTREEHEAEDRDEEPSLRRPNLPPTSDAVRTVSLLMVGPVVLLGVYIVSHGQLSPGGGFQGGVILATALLLVYLAGRYRRMRKIGPVTLAQLADAAGAGGFVVIGLAALIAGAAFLTDTLPLGPSSTLATGGTIALISFSIGLEVAGGILAILSEFLEQALRVASR